MDIWSDSSDEENKLVKNVTRSERSYQLVWPSPTQDKEKEKVVE